MISERALDRLSGMLREPDVTGTRYELRGVLGRGGMGVVYLARDTVLDRDVALKIVDRADARGGSHRAAGELLATEARILARLEHPGIVPVHDFGELADGRLFYAMKRVRGDRLDRWLAAGHDLAARLAVFVRVCDAVAFAHAHGVVHRDLKPENVMIGEFGEVLVLDWGIARVGTSSASRGRGADPAANGGRIPRAEHTPAPDQRSHTDRTPYSDRNADTGTSNSNRTATADSNDVRIPNPDSQNPDLTCRLVAGTPEYMAPEQRRGDPDVDHRADIYALGVILETLGDATPLTAIARKARADDRAARYQSVQDLAADVRRFLAGSAVGAHRERLVDRIARVWRRYKVPILLVVTYLAVRLLLIWLARV